MRFLLTICLLSSLFFTNSFAQIQEKIDDETYFEMPLSDVSLLGGEPLSSEQPITEMTFEEVDFNYGTIQAGDIVRNVFRFTNTGSEPLIITNAKGSCGCTVPIWPKHPIAPGETGEFVAEFNSKNKKGKQSKRVTITANTDPGQTFLTVRGEVIPRDEDKSIKRTAPKAKKPSLDIATSDVVLAPNPTSDELRLSLKNLTGQSAEIQIYNHNGQLMERRPVDEISAESIRFDVQNYTPGFYTISVTVEGADIIAKQFAVVR